jgi:hypothetical protein
MGFFDRIGNKVSTAYHSAKRIGNKALDSVENAVRIGGKAALKVGHVAGQVGKVVGTIGKYGKMVTPFLAAVPVVGGPVAAGLTAGMGALEGIGRGAQMVGAAADKVSAGIQSGERIVRAGRNILQRPSTTMANIRTITREGGRAASSMKGAVSEARRFGTR